MIEVRAGAKEVRVGPRGHRFNDEPPAQERHERAPEDEPHEEDGAASPAEAARHRGCRRERCGALRWLAVLKR